MEETAVIAFRGPVNFQADPLTEALQAGAHKLSAQAINAEVASFLEAHAALMETPGVRQEDQGRKISRAQIAGAGSPGGVALRAP